MFSLSRSKEHNLYNRQIAFAFVLVLALIVIEIWQPDDEEEGNDEYEREFATLAGISPQQA